MAEMSPEKKLDVCQKSLWMIIARMVRAIDEKYGDEGLDAVYTSIRDWDAHKANLVRYGLTPGKVTPLEMAERVMIPTGDIAFSMKQQPLVTQDRKTGRVTYKAVDCNVAQLIGKECAKTCATISRAVEVGQAKAANPKMKVSGDKWLATGHDGCYIYLELEK